MPRPLRTRGISATPTYLRSPGVETRLQLADHRLPALRVLAGPRAARWRPFSVSSIR